MNQPNLEHQTSYFELQTWNQLPPQYPCKNQWRYNSCVAFDNIFWCIDIQFTPGNLFIGHCPGVRTKGSSAVADLAEITPERYIMPFKILVHHGHDANREIAGNPTAYLK